MYMLWIQLKWRFNPTEAVCQKDDPGTSALTNIVEVFRDPAFLKKAAFGLEPDLDIRERI